MKLIRNTYYVVCTLLVLLSTACARIGIGATPRPTYIFTPSEIVGSLTHAGRARAYTVHFPPALVLERRYPLIIVLRFVRTLHRCGRWRGGRASFTRHTQQREEQEDQTNDSCHH